MSCRKRRIQYAMGGLSMTIIGCAFYYYWRSNASSYDNSIYLKVKGIRQSIDDYCKLVQNQEVKLKDLLKNKDQHIQLFQDVYTSSVDVEQLNKEIDAVPFLKQLVNAKLENNYQAQIMKIDIIKAYDNHLNIETVIEQLQAINEKQKLLHNQEFSLTPSIVTFLKFIFNSFFVILQELELVLSDKQKNQEHTQLNYMITCLLDFTSSLVKENQKLGYLIGQSLLLTVKQFEQEDYNLAHICEDTQYQQKILVHQSNKNCTCKLLSLIFRYSSLLSQKTQTKIYHLFLDNQIYYTIEQLQCLTSELLKNSFYLCSKLRIQSSLFHHEPSPLMNLLLIGTLQNDVRKATFPDLDILMLYQEKLIHDTSPKFWNKCLKLLITQHIMIYPYFMNSLECNKIYEEYQSIGITIVLHFLGILVMLENRETFDAATLCNIIYQIKKGEINSEFITSWMANNIDTMLATERLALLQYKFLRQVINSNRNQQEFIRQFFSGYIQCIRVSQNKRIENSQKNKKYVEVSCYLSKLFPFMIAGFCEKIPTRKNFKEILSRYPIQDKQERLNIFSNILRILFDLSSMNLHFLRYIQPQCEKISPEGAQQFIFYLGQIMSCQTISFDLYMFAMQIGFLFGDYKILLIEMKKRLEQDVLQLANFEDFYVRDVIIRKYYFYKRSLFQLIFLKILITISILYNFFKVRHYLQIWRCWYQLQKNALIAIANLNGDMTISQLLETSKMFLHIQEIPIPLIEELFQPRNKQNTLRLKPEFQNTVPFMCLQKDMASVNIFLEQCNKKSSVDLFKEIYQSYELEYLENMRRRLYLDPLFQDLLKTCIFSDIKARQCIYPWGCKFLYYGKKVISWYQKTKPQKKEKEFESLQNLIKSQEVKKFSSEIKKKKHCQQFFSQISEIKI